MTPVETIKESADCQDLYSEEDRQKDAEIIKDIESGIRWQNIKGVDVDIVQAMSRT